MKEAVDKKSPEFLAKADMVILCLGHHLGNTDYDISEESRVTRGPVVIHRKGKHIGRPVYGAIFCIEASHPSAAHE
jgi:hypothetical protein